VRLDSDARERETSANLPGSMQYSPLRTEEPTTKVGIDQIVETGLQILDGYASYAATPVPEGEISPFPPFPGQEPSLPMAGVDSSPLTASLGVLNGMLGFLSPVPEPELPHPSTENKME